jgi:RimJ/RimL family protein N-acetyltransferase
MEHERIEAHGVVLRRLRREDIERVRAWRNQPGVNRFMERREEITREGQERWFAGLDPARQFFYLIEWQGHDVGVVNLKDLDAAAGCAEGGIYIADAQHRNGLAGLAAMLAMYDFGFEVLGLRRVVIHVLRDNPRAIRFNQGLGFRLADGQEAVANQLYELEKDEYFSNTRRFRALLASAGRANG